MKSIDAEIAAVEQRIGQRKLTLAGTTRAAKRKAARTVVPPLAVVGALALGFFVAQRARRRGQRSEPVVAQDTREQSKGFALGTLLMTGATWFIRSQFGGPVGLAQFVLSRLHGGRSPATAVPAEHRPQVPR
jgi:hypothetical protein